MPHSIKGSCNSPNEYYHPHPCSPPHQHVTKTISISNSFSSHVSTASMLSIASSALSLVTLFLPPLCQFNYSSNQCHPQQVMWHSSLPQHEPPRLHNYGPTSSLAQRTKPMELNPFYMWGESLVDLTPLWPTTSVLVTPADLTTNTSAPQPLGGLELSTDGQTTAGPSGMSGNSDE